ncbi:MAG: ATP synthase F1 subunit delta [Myxococcales bacterium]|nr:ATP synthase F1 subunit delta [Myxococcales bacterium]
MRNATIAHRYAQALLSLGIERNNQDQIGRELDRISLVFRTSRELREVCLSPKFKKADRKSVLVEVLKRVMVSPVTRNFLLLLVDRGRVGSLIEIVEAFHELADAESGRVRAQVSVASSLTEPESARLKTILQKLTGKKVIIEQQVDPSLVGGVVTRIAGKVYDGSVRAQLATLGRGLSR